jgi:hypothetical protein
MLIQLTKGAPVHSFQELFGITLSILGEFPGEKKTVVLGPVTSDDPVVTQNNLAMLACHAKGISGRGWVVLDIASYQETIQVLIEKLHIQGYPHEVLHDFSLPLIGTGVFQKVFFRDCYRKSFGASLEHQYTLEMGIPIEYLP